MFFNPYSPSMEFFTKFCCQRRFLTKSKWIYMVLFLKKKTNLVQKSQNIFSSVDANRRRVQVFFKKKTKCLGSNKNVNVALFWVVVQSKHLWHWKRYFILILKFCLNYPIRSKARKLLKFAVFDICLSCQIVCCSYVSYMYKLNQSANYYTFIM